MEGIEKETTEDTMRDDPMFNRGVTHTVELLAKQLGVTDWIAGDGSEDYDEDLQQTLLNIVEAKGLYSSEDGTWATIAAAPHMGAGREDQLRYQKRQTRDLRRHLTALTTANLEFLEALDRIMREPQSPGRGKKVARLSNFLEVANDGARYGGLKINFRDDASERRLLAAQRSYADQFAEVLREHWSFDDGQQHTHSWHSREDFIKDVLPGLLTPPPRSEER